MMMTTVEVMHAIRRQFEFAERGAAVPVWMTVDEILATMESDGRVQIQPTREQVVAALRNDVGFIAFAKAYWDEEHRWALCSSVRPLRLVDETETQP